MRGMLPNRPLGSFLILSALLLLAIVICAAGRTEAQAGDKSIGEIRRIYRETNERIEAAAKNFPESSIFLTELIVNKGGTMYPAVGIFRSTVKFYFTFGDREENPYPNRLLKITVLANRAARQEWSEYLFDPAGQLIFQYEKKGEGREDERRYYFASGKLIALTIGQKDADVNSREALDSAAAALGVKEKLVGLFRQSANL